MIAAVSGLKEGAAANHNALMNQDKSEQGDQKTVISRTRVGVLAIVCLASAAGTFFFARTNEALLSAFLRVGLVLAALWLALPPQGQSIAWEKITPFIVGAVVLVVVTKKAFVFVLPVAIVVAIAFALLRPKPKRRPGDSMRNR